MNEDIVVNNKVYPMWQQFVHKKEEFIGGIIVNEDMGMSVSTEITDVILEPNGAESAMFGFKGKDFDFIGDVTSIGISGRVEKVLVVSSRYCGDCFVYRKGEVPKDLSNE